MTRWTKGEPPKDGGDYMVVAQITYQDGGGRWSSRPVYSAVRWGRESWVHADTNLSVCLDDEDALRILWWSPMPTESTPSDLGEAAESHSAARRRAMEGAALRLACRDGSEIDVDTVLALVEEAFAAGWRAAVEVASGKLRPPEPSPAPSLQPEPYATIP